MSPEIVASTLSSFLEVLADMKKHVSASTQAQQRSHYEIERQVQLCVDLATAMARRILSLAGHPVPATAREVFAALSKASFVTEELAGHMSLAVGLRNLLVHEYGKIDYEKFFQGLGEGYEAFVKYAEVISKLLKKGF